MDAGGGHSAYPTLAVLTRYTRRAASSRVRQLAFLDRLKADGHPITVQSLLPDSHLDVIYGLRQRRAYSEIALGYARRARFMAQLPSNSVAWIEKEVFPKLPAACDLAALYRCSATVLDLDDAWFLLYEEGARPFIHDKITTLIRRVDFVTVPNRTMAEEVAARGARRIRLFAPCVDTCRFAPKHIPVSGGPPIIGWIGTPLTAAAYLPPLAPVLNDLSRKGRARIVLVGAGNAVPELNAERRDWTEENEAAEVAAFDIGIMPLSNSLWDQCKSGFKLLQTMASGRLAIGSAVGFNRELIAHGENGLLIPADVSGSDARDAWAHALGKALDDQDLRAALGAKARETVVLRYDMSVREAEISQFFGSLK